MSFRRLTVFFWRCFWCFCSVFCWFFCVVLCRFLAINCISAIVTLPYFALYFWYFLVLLFLWYLKLLRVPFSLLVHSSWHMALPRQGTRVLNLFIQNCVLPKFAIGKLYIFWSIKETPSGYVSTGNPAFETVVSAIIFKVRKALLLKSQLSTHPPLCLIELNAV